MTTTWESQVGTVPAHFGQGAAYVLLCHAGSQHAGSKIVVYEVQSWRLLQLQVAYSFRAVGTAISRASTWMMLYTHVCTDLLAHAIRLLSVNRAECGGIDISHIRRRL